MSDTIAAGASLRRPKPQSRPRRPFFSSGPCAKPPGWLPQSLDTSALGRSHRGAIGKAKLHDAIARTHALLGLPSDYRLGIVPASDTGAMEMAIWSFLGPRPVTMLAWESFGAGWVTDVAKQLELEAEIRTADYGEIARLDGIDPASDLVFTWNGTTSGVRVPDADWIAADRTGLSICDATSAAFAQGIDWSKIDVGTFSWQKALGGEAAHGMLVLVPARRRTARARAGASTAPQDLPPDQKRQADRRHFPGRDHQHALDARRRGLAVRARLGRAHRRPRRADRARRCQRRGARSLGAVGRLDRAFGEGSGDPFEYVGLPSIRRARDAEANKARQKAIAKLLEAEDAAYDIGAYRDAPPGLRIWCGATVDTADIEALGPWLDWAWRSRRSSNLRTG